MLNGEEVMTKVFHSGTKGIRLIQPLVAGRLYFLKLAPVRPAVPEMGYLAEYKLIAVPQGPCYASSFVAPEVSKLWFDLDKINENKKRMLVRNVMGVINSVPELHESSTSVPYKTLSIITRTGSAPGDIGEHNLTLWGAAPAQRQYGNSPYDAINNFGVGRGHARRGDACHDGRNGVGGGGARQGAFDEAPFHGGRVGREAQEEDARHRRDGRVGWDAQEEARHCRDGRVAWDAQEEARFVVKLRVAANERCGGSRVLRHCERPNAWTAPQPWLPAPAG
jgi:hypothetical protein